MNEHFWICRALVALGYETGWLLSGNDLDGITWVDEKISKPNNAALTAKISELKANEAKAI